MHYYRLVIAYKGSQYFGWQDQGADVEKPTVQAAVQQVLKNICKFKECTVSAASRTDAGVHAQGQVAKISIPTEINAEKLLLGMNSQLPDDIRIRQCVHCSAEFNANKDSKSKEYHYYFCTDSVHNPSLNDTVAHIPSNQSKNMSNKSKSQLDIKLMKEACKLFVGEHDFYSFATRDTTIASTIRNIVSCEIVETQGLSYESKVYCLKVVGNGFLKQMVRYIAGALFSVGKNELELNAIYEALLSRKDEKLSPRAKSRGLHLIRINY